MAGSRAPTCPELLAAADILVQPGRSNPYNDYRFPSKLPDFLASGRPVVLPRTNIGLHLRDGAEALILERCDAAESSEKVALLAANPELRLNISPNRLIDLTKLVPRRGFQPLTYVGISSRVFRTADARRYDNQASDGGIIAPCLAD